MEQNYHTQLSYKIRNKNICEVSSYVLDFRLAHRFSFLGPLVPMKALKGLTKVGPTSRMSLMVRG